MTGLVIGHIYLWPIIGPSIAFLGLSDWVLASQVRLPDCPLGSALLLDLLAWALGLATQPDLSSQNILLESWPRILVWSLDLKYWLGSLVELLDWAHYTGSIRPFLYAWAQGLDSMYWLNVWALCSCFRFDL